MSAEVEANYAVQYPERRKDWQQRAQFAWFITRNDAKVFADMMKRREDIEYKVVKL